MDLALFERLKAAVPTDQGRAVWYDAQFDEARFTCDAKFDGACFKGAVRFFKTVFQGAAEFNGGLFDGDAYFSGASFRSDSGWSDFRNTRFLAKACFNGAVFHGEAHFADSELVGDASFWGATFHRRAGLEDAIFRGRALFVETTFEGVGDFTGTQLDGEVRFERAVFMRDALFKDAVLGSGELRLCSVLFSRGVNVEVQGPAIVLDESKFDGPALVRGTADPSTPRPRVVSLCNADVANLVLSNLDLRRCRFAGAHNLDRLRIESRDAFDRTPKGWRWHRGWPPVWRWTDRQLVAEEHAWRLTHEPTWKWHATSPQLASVPAGRSGEEEALELASTYRALRKGREDNKDEPGAGDFYYGEMEMRRKAAAPRSVERVVLSAYWLFSGYALRAGRVLLWLGAMILASSALFQAFGFESSITFGRALVFTLDTTADLFRSSERLTSAPPLTGWGEALGVAVRVVGPLLLGLAVLSLRGRIKR